VSFSTAGEGFGEIVDLGSWANQVWCYPLEEEEIADHGAMNWAQGDG